MEIPPCGAHCKNCVAYKKTCEGCIETSGNPYYVKESGEGVCPVWECAARRGVEHCGLCGEFPCEKFLAWYSPRRGIITVLRRAGLLTLRKKIGDDTWKKWLDEHNIQFGT